MPSSRRISASEIRDQVKADLVQAFKGEVLSDYEFEFRASSLPFCSRAFVLHHRYKDETPSKPFGYNFGFYVTIGTAVHEVLQTFLGMAGMLYGDWVCCGVTEYARIGSKTCPVCGNPQKYEEIAPSSVLGMHVDGISVKYNAVLEYKTTGSSNLESLKEPYPKHLVQASCYVHALNEENGWDLDKIIFIYLSRDKPSDYKIFVSTPNPNVYDDAVKQLNTAKKSLREGVLPERECASSSAGAWRSCPYTGICFKSPEDFLLPVESLCLPR